MDTIMSTEQVTQAELIRPGEAHPVEVLGIRMDWKVREADTGGHYSLLELLVPPGAGVPLHQHAEQETFYLAEGEAEFARIGREGITWYRVTLGDTVNVPGWAMHGFRNTGAVSARILLTCSAGLEAFFTEIGVALVPGGSQPSVPPSQADIERVVSAAMRHGHRFAPLP